MSKKDLLEWMDDWIKQATDLLGPEFDDPNCDNPYKVKFRKKKLRYVGARLSGDSYPEDLLAMEEELTYLQWASKIFE